MAACLPPPIHQAVTDELGILNKIEDLIGVPSQLRATHRPATFAFQLGEPPSPS